jgi:hypothetical protein
VQKTNSDIKYDQNTFIKIGNLSTSIASDYLHSATVYKKWFMYTKNTELNMCCTFKWQRTESLVGQANVNIVHCRKSSGAQSEWVFRLVEGVEGGSGWRGRRRRNESGVDRDYI